MIKFVYKAVLTWFPKKKQKKTCYWKDEKKTFWVPTMGDCFWIYENNSNMEFNVTIIARETTFSLKEAIKFTAEFLKWLENV